MAVSGTFEENFLQDGVKLVVDDEGYIHRVIERVRNTSVPWCTELSGDDDRSSEEPTEPIPKLANATGRAVPEHFVKRLEECDQVVSARVFHDPSRLEHFHRVPRAVAIQWKTFVCAAFANLDFCHGVSVRKMSRVPNVDEWQNVIKRTTGNSVNDPGILLPAEKAIAMKYTHECFADDPILRVSEGRDGTGDVRGATDSSWAPQLTNRGA